MEQNKYDQIRQRGISGSKESNGHPKLLTSYLRPLIADIRTELSDQNNLQEKLVNIANKEAQVLALRATHLEKELEKQNSFIAEKEKYIIDQEQENIKKIEELKNEKNKIEQKIDELLEPKDQIFSKHITWSKPKKRITLFLIFVLSIFLWIFYASSFHNVSIRNILKDQFSAYNTKRRQISSKNANNTNNRINNSTSIVNLNSFSDAYDQYGLYGVVFLATAACIPMGGGYLIYIFQRKRRTMIGILAVMFILDCILAYHIVEEIYIAKRNTMAGYEDEWTFLQAFKGVNFWFILFCSFVVYILWGVLVEAYLTSSDHNAPVMEKITNYKSQISTLDTRLNELTMANDTIVKKIRGEIVEIKDEKMKIDKAHSAAQNDANLKLKEIESLRNKIPIPKYELESRVESFVGGWCTWVISKSRPNEEEIINECQNIKEEFVTMICSSEEYIIINT